MELGVVLFGSHPDGHPADIAVKVEERCFESLWFSEHTHIPVRRETPWPGGDELPAAYWHMLDPFVALAAAASVTKRLRLGTGICLVVQHDPIVLAKTVATLDVVSNGRVLLGVGVGWNREEMRNHGTDPRTRTKLLRERVEAMKAIWTQDEAEYHGDLVDFDPILAFPKPVQRPHPPVLIGGNVEEALPRVVAYGDEWLPHRVPLDDLPRHIETLQELAAQAGRGPIPVTSYGPPPQADHLRKLDDLGIHRAVLVVPAGPLDEVERVLDEHAQLVSAVA